MNRCAPEDRRIEQWTSNPIPSETITPLKCADYICFQKHCIVSVRDLSISIYPYIDLYWTLYGHQIKRTGLKIHGTLL